jgi:hypothetical protein
MNRLQQHIHTTQEPNPQQEALLFWNARSGSLLAYRAIQVRLRDRDIGERVIRERVIQKRDMRETVATSWVAEELLLHITIPGFSGFISILQSWHCWARCFQCHKPRNLQATEGMSLSHWWSWERLPGLWPMGIYRSLWP